MEDVEGALRAKRDLPSAIIGEFGGDSAMRVRSLAARWDAFEGSWIYDKGSSLSKSTDS